MQLLVDTREKAILDFPKINGLEIKKECLLSGDYGFRHSNGEMDKSLIERKSTADLYHSFTHEYENEKEKMVRARQAGFRYILAIEAPSTEVMLGHSYMKKGIEHQVRKSGMAQVRQIMTLHKRGDLDEVWWCKDRTEMAFLIQEYFLAQVRINEKKPKS